MAQMQRTITVFHRQGLHARPSALFVQVAKRYGSRVTVKRGRQIVDGKSIMGLLTLAAKRGSRIVIMTEGADAAESLERLCMLVTQPLPEASKPASESG